MIQFFKSENGTLEPRCELCTGSWVHMTDPSKEELEKISKDCGVEMDFLSAALDEEETPRIEKEDEATLILVDIPIVEPEGTSFLYNTVPLGIIITENNLITVCLRRFDDFRGFLQRQGQRVRLYKKDALCLSAAVQDVFEVPAVPAADRKGQHAGRKRVV